MRRLRPAGISAWSSVSPLGSASSLNRVPLVPSLSALLQGTGLHSHEAELRIPGFSGRVSSVLSPLPPAAAHHESRAARLFLASLAPLVDSINAVCLKYGPERVGLVLGSSTGGIDGTESALRNRNKDGAFPDSYSFYDVHPYDALLRLAELCCSLRGPSLVVSTACSSGGKALAAAQRLLHNGMLDAVLVGGVDALCETTVRGFAGLGVLSSETPQPFSATRTGISIGEGAALLLLENSDFLENQGTTPVYFLGAGESSDAFHPTSPDPDGVGAGLAIARCLLVAGLDASEVDYVNAHGTGTEKNDSMEARAIATSIGQNVPFSSTKDRTGHLLGTAGALEALLCVRALSEQQVPLNLPPKRQDPELFAQPICEQRQAELRVALSNSFAFGGSNVSVALGLSAGDRFDAARTLVPVEILSVAAWSPYFSQSEELLAFLKRPSEAPRSSELPQALSLPARARGRASVLTRVFADLMDQLVQKSRGALDPSRIPTVYGSSLGEMATTIELLKQLGTDTTLSPLKFQNSVHNTSSGLLSLTHKNREFSTCLAAGANTFPMALFEGQSWLSAHGGEVLVLVADESSPSYLSTDKSFCALGYAFHLRAQAGTGSSPSLATFTGLSRQMSSADTSNGVARSSALLGELLQSPLSSGLPLLKMLAEIEQTYGSPDHPSPEISAPEGYAPKSLPPCALSPEWALHLA